MLDLVIDAPTPTFESKYLDDMDYAMLDAMEASCSTKLYMATLEMKMLLDISNSDGQFVMEEASIDADKAPIARRKTNGFMEGLKEFLRKMSLFLANSIESFAKAVEESISSDEEWFKNYAHYLDTKSWEDPIKKTIKISVVPYWEGSKKSAIERLGENGIPMKGSYETVMQEIENNAATMQKKEDLFAKYFPTLYRLDPKNIKNAAVMYWRGENNPVKKTFTEANAEAAVRLMLNFLQNYPNYTTKAKNSEVEYQKNVKWLSGNIERMEREYFRLVQKNGTTETVHGKEVQTKNSYSATVNATKTTEGSKQTAGASVSTTKEAYANLTDYALQGTEFVYDSTMYSMMEDKCLDSNDFPNVLVTEATTGVNAVAGAETAKTNQTNTNTQANPQDPPAGGDTGGGKGNPPKPPTVGTAGNDDANKNAGQGQQQQQDAANIKRVEEYCKYMNSLVCTVVEVRKTILEEVHHHFLAVSKEIISAIERYRKNQDEHAGNVQYNYQKAKDRKEAVDSAVQARRDAARIQGANDGVLTQLWKKIF